MATGKAWAKSRRQNAMADDGDKLARAYARLVGLKESLPDWATIPERYVEEFHSALAHLADLGFDVAEFKIPPDDLGRVNYSPDDLHVPRPLFLAKLTAVLTYFSIQGSSGGEKRRIGFNPGDGGS
jgi:hypothetical protein